PCPRHRLWVGASRGHHLECGDNEVQARTVAGDGRRSPGRTRDPGPAFLSACARKVTAMKGKTLLTRFWNFEAWAGKLITRDDGPASRAAVPTAGERLRQLQGGGRS